MAATDTAASAAVSLSRPSSTAFPGSSFAPASPLADTSSDRPALVVTVLGRKGGVGKSFLVRALALNLAARGMRVGVLDADLCCPSMHTALVPSGESRDIRYEQRHGWVPVTVRAPAPPGKTGGGHIKVVSMAMLLPPNQPASYAWLPHRKRLLVEQFVSRILWGPLDVLLVDTPPSVGEVHTAVLDFVRGEKRTCAVLVSDGSAASAAATESDVLFCTSQQLRVAGIAVTNSRAAGLADRGAAGGGGDGGGSGGSSGGDAELSPVGAVSEKYKLPVLATVDAVVAALTSQPGGGGGSR
jgi:Mrp family chromosome partitioning ATPase